MIKTKDYKKDDTKASLQRILDEQFVVEIGEAGLLDSDLLNSLGLIAMTARSEIPTSHRRIADSYMLMKKMYGTPVVQGQLSRAENSILRRYDFNRLEYSTIRQINEELAFLQSQSSSRDSKLRMDCDKILEIRAKELKFIVASRYAQISNEMFNGYLAIEKYFELISSYSKPSKPI